MVRRAGEFGHGGRRQHHKHDHHACARFLGAAPGAPTLSEGRRRSGIVTAHLPLRRTVLVVLLALAVAPAAWAERALPASLRLAPNQCPPWTAEDRPRQEYLTDAVGAGQPPYRLRGDPPIRLDEVGVWVVNGVRHAIPVGHMPRQLNDEIYEEAVRGGGHETTGLYGLAFWMPSGRMVERQFGSYQRFCEPGRAPPGPEEYAIGATVLPPGSAEAAEWRAERLLWRERTEAALGASIADVLAGRVPEHADRVVPDIPGAVVYDGLFWSGRTSERAPNPDPLRRDMYILSKGDLFGTLYCPAVVVVARTDRTRAKYTDCDVRVGPADPDGRLPELSYTIPYRDAAQWADVYDVIITKIERWRLQADG